MMETYLKILRAGNSLSEGQAQTCYEELFLEEFKDSDLVEFLTLLNKKGVVADEISGFWKFLYANCKRCILNSESLFDVCGTGGDGKSTINISTLTAFILAACGEQVAKHGNYSASSSIGSSNLLEALGVPLIDSEVKAREIFSVTGLIFLHAPYWHPLLKKVSTVRKSLGVRTVFNLLGPLLNPCAPKFQLIGTPSEDSARLLSKAVSLREASAERKHTIISDLNGYDEVSLTGECKCFISGVESILSPQDFGAPVLRPHELELPSTLEQVVLVSENLLKGKGEPAHEAVVAANTALALHMKYADQSLQSLFVKAQSAIKSGKGFDLLERFRGLK